MLPVYLLILSGTVEFGRAFFAYGTCVIEAGQEGGCAVPIQIQIFPFEPSLWRRAARTTT